MQRDPRSTRRYKQAARAYLDKHTGTHVACVLCSLPVDMTLPSTHRHGPTVEHVVPVRVIREQARTWGECVDWACDPRSWGIAHWLCQARQGAHAANQSRPQHSRVW